MKLRVCCVGGRDPRSFFVGERRLFVMQVLECVVADSQHRFRVRVVDGREFVLHHELETGDWRLARVSARRS